MGEVAAAPDEEDVDEVLERLRRRVRSSLAHGKKQPNFDADPVDYLEQFFVRRSDAFVEDVFLLGLARHRMVRAISQEVHETLQPVLALLQGYIEIGVHVNNLCLGGWRLPGRPKTKINALTQIHARALLIADEVFTLLSMGFPSGASALCRTQYELSIYAKFLDRNPAAVSERYMVSHVVEMWKRQEDDKRARIDQLDPEVMAFWDELDARYEQLIGRHGPEMRFENGWAWPIFSVSRHGRARKPGRISFDEIDDFVGETDRKWRYRSASHYVHGGHLGTVKSLVVHRSGVLTLGPRDVGLESPATDCLWDLHEIEEVLLRSMYRSNRDPEILYWLELQTLAVTAMHLVINETLAGI